MRVIEAVLPERYEQDMREVVKTFALVDRWVIPVDDHRVVFRLVVEADQAEGVMDELVSQFSSEDEFRLVLLPVEAVRPWSGGDSNGQEKQSFRQRIGFTFTRVSRQELYHDIYDACGLTPMFLSMVVLSTVVAAAGLLRDNTAAIIGAMVIAPLLGPNSALAMATTVGDFRLGVRAVSSAVVGVTLAFLMAVAIGLYVDIDVTATEIASRTQIGIPDILIALAAGVAGSLAFTSGAPTSLVGVMVAVALLPPTVVFGMLVGAKEWQPAMGALLIVVANLTSLNVAGIATFLSLGLRPRLWSKRKGARLIAFTILFLWVAFLAGIVVTIMKVYGG